MATELNDSDELTDALKIQLSTLATLITDDGYELVSDTVVQELGWDYPVTTPAKVLWMIKRGTRHSLNLLRLASANKFKYKLVNLQNRFEHFQKLIEDMDKEFADAMIAEASLFSDTPLYALFGTKIDAGFSYRKDGKDETYFEDRYVNFSPMEA
jgi:hypothetical protein